MKLTYSLAAFAALAALVVLILALPVSAATHQQASSDKTLAALTVNDGAVDAPLRPTFASATTSYRVAVKHGSDQVTISATTTDTKATVTYEDLTNVELEDADAATLEHQIDVPVGELRINVKVTAENGTTEVYEIVVERDSAQLFGWSPTRDINTLEAAGNADPQGIWSDATTMWVADSEDNKLYAYTLATGARDTAKEFNLHADNADPRGIWSDDTTMWVADSEDNKLYAYALSGGARDATKDIDLHVDNADPRGIWSDRTTVWVADVGQLYAYTVVGGARDPDKEFDPIQDAVGIWADGTTMWVSVQVGHLRRVDAYTLDLDASGNAGPNHGVFDTDKWLEQLFPAEGSSVMGIWSDGSRSIWVVDTDNPKLHSFNMPPSTAGGVALSDLSIHDGTNNAALRPAFDISVVSYRTSVSNDVNLVTVRPTGDSGAVVTYLDVDGDELEDADSRTTGFQVYVAEGTTVIRILVAAMDGAALIHTVVVERDSARPGGRTPTKDIHDLDPVNIRYPQGVWSDGTTMWVTNRFTEKIFAYTLATGVRDGTREFPLHGDNGRPTGIWSDKTTIWVVDSQDRKLYAYTLSGGARDATKDIDLDTNNAIATGIWSDGTTAWVADFNASKVFAYDLATNAPDATKGFDLSANGLRNTGIWSDGTTVWVTDWEADKLYAYTLSGGARDENRDIALINAFALGIWGDGTTIWVADASLFFLATTDFHRVYTYLLPPSSPSDVTLRSLAVSPSRGAPSFSANLRPAFSFTAFFYRVAVPTYARRVTVDATANNRRTPVAYLNPRGEMLEDADSGTPGFQVDLAVGETAIDLRLAAGGTALAYTLIVERDSAELYGWTPTKDFNNLLQNNPLLAGDSIRGVWGNETTMYVMGFEKPKIFAYARTTGARDESKDIATDQGPAAPGRRLATNAGFQASIWSDGTTIWVLNYRYGEDDQGTETDDGSGMVFAYTLSNGVRDTTKEFPLHLATINAARGIWSDGTTVWVSDYKAAKLFAYTLAGGARIPRKDITLRPSNDSAQGIWGDGTTIWVAQWNSSRFYGYTLATGLHDPDKDFDRVPANHYPREIWSDGKTLYVTEHFGTKLFAYNMVSTNSPATGRPVISGELEVGHTLTVSTSGIRDDNGLTNPGYTYQWQRLDGGVYTDISGPNAMVYTLTPDDRGKRIRVKVTFTDDDGSRHMLTSLDTGTVQPQKSIPAGKVKVSLDATAYVVEEGQTLQVTVTLAEAPEEGPVYIRFTVTPGNGARRSEFDAWSSSSTDSLRFAAGQSTDWIKIRPDDDTLNDDGETIRLCLDNLPDPYATLAGLNCATVNIMDNDDPNSVRVMFRRDTYWASEDGNPAWPRINVHPVPDREITIPITFTRGGGLSASDHGAVTTSVTFGPGLYGVHGDGHLTDGRTYASFPIEIWAIDDMENDDGEYMDLAFGEMPPFVSVGGTGKFSYRPTTARVWFNDNEFTQVSVTDPPNPLGFSKRMEVTFADAELEAKEGLYEIGSVATVRVQLSRRRDMESQVIIPIFRSLHGATDGVDFAGVPDNLIFLPGQTEQSFRVRAINDDVDDDGEYLTFRFGTLPDLVYAGDQASVRVDLVDDDDPPVEVSFEQANYEVTNISRDGDTEYARLNVKVKLSAAPERFIDVGIVAESIQGDGDIRFEYSAYIPRGPHSGAHFYEEDTEFRLGIYISASDGFDANQTYRLTFDGMSYKMSAGSPATATITINPDP